MTEGNFTNRARSYDREAEWILSPRFIEPLVPAVTGRGNMLDVCAGTGVVAEYAWSRGWKPTALDSNEAMLHGVEAHIRRCRGDAHRMPFEDHSFDLVVCRQGLQYLDPPRAIGEMLRVSADQVRLLHGFVGSGEILLWSRLFALSGRPGRDFFSDEHLARAIEDNHPARWEQHFLHSREWFAKKTEHRTAIEAFLRQNPQFVESHRIQELEDGFYYDLKWVLHIIRK